MNLINESPEWLKSFRNKFVRPEGRPDDHFLCNDFWIQFRPLIPMSRALASLFLFKHIGDV